MRKYWELLMVAALAVCAAQGETIKMMSFNIRMGCGLSDPFQLAEGSLGYLPQCAEVIKAAAPDWVAIQEIDRNTDRAGHVDQTAELARLCGLKGTFVSKVTKPGGEYGLALLSKEEPISVSKVLMAGSAHTRAVLIAEFTNYVVACTHFPLTAENRLNAARVVKETFANESKPVFLAGDLNASPSEASITSLAERFTILTDTNKPTFRADNPTSCIDYIMVDHGHAARVTVKDRQVIAAPEATDHCALTVTAEVKFPGAVTGGGKLGVTGIATLADAVVGNVSTQNCLYGGAALTDFQVPVYLKEGKNGFSYSGYAADASDLRVTDLATGTLLPYEIETWNTSGTSVVWVKVPTFSPATKLVFSGGDASASQATGQGDSIWTDAYKVFHFGDTLAKDSSPFGTIMSVSETDTQDSPVVRGFHGGTSGRRLGATGMPPADMGQMGNTFSVSFWMKLDSLTQPSCYVFQVNAPGQWAVVYNYVSGALGLFSGGASSPGIGSSDATFAMPVPTDMKWHHYAFTYDGTIVRMYRDGVEVKTRTSTFTFLTRTANDGSFYLMGNAGSTRLQGTLDEFRLESVARSADWIKAIYHTSHLEEVHVAGGLYDGSETLTDFILPVSFRANRGGFTTAQQIRMKEDRSSFRFVNELDEELEYETELLAQESEVNSVFWVKVPKFTKDTVVKLRLLDGGCPSDTYVSTDTVNSNLWDESYVHVWHLADTARRWDSTAAAMNLSPEGSGHSWVNNPAAADGPTGRYLAMQTGTNSSAFAAAKSSALRSLRKLFTLSFWARKEDIATPKQSYAWQFYVGSTQFAVVAGYYSDDKNCFSLYDSRAGTRLGIHIPDEEWHHYAFVSDGTNLIGYRDGESVGTLHPTIDFGQDAGAAEKAHRVGLSGGLAQGLIGAMDEFRIENVTRSAAWIKALYQTQRIFRKGVARLPSPIFGVGDSATCLSTSELRFEAELVCQQPSSVWLCYGPSDGGQNTASWTNALPLGELAEGTIATNLTGLAADTGVSARFFASNAYGTAWSPLLQARTGTERGVKAAKIAVTGYDGAETLVDFPLCAMFDASFGLPETAAEVRFLTEDGIALPYEVEEWNPAGESIVWIRVPELSAGTTIYATWGRAFGGTTTSWHKTAVWGSGYNFVWHLSDALTDSSRIGANLSGGSSYVTATNGVIGQGRYLVKKTEGNDCTATNYEPKDIGGAFTYSYWAKMDALTGQQYLLNTVYASNGRISMIYGFSGNTMEIYLQPSSALDWSLSATREREYFRSLSQIPVTDSEWHHYAWSYDGRILRSYQDGALVKSGLVNASIGQPFPAYALHQSTIFGGGSGMTGAMDEIRLESVERSSDWIRACYLNQTGQLCTLTPPFDKGTLLFIL